MHEYFDHEEVKRFFKFLGIAVVFLTVFIAAKAIVTLKELNQPEAAINTIVVSGTGEAFAAPDVATFTFTVSADAQTVGGAQDTVSSSATAITTGLEGLGIAEKDIQTSDYSVYPKYTYQPVICTPGVYCPPSKQIPDGYTVSESFSVKVRKTSDAGQALSIAGAKGATNISSLTFTLDNPDAVQAEARDNAIANAKTKAEDLAKSLGVSLGRVVDFNESGVSPMPYPVVYSMAAGGASADSKSVPISTGQNKVTSNVSVTYEIR